MTFNKRSGVAGLTLVFGVLALVLVQGQAKPMCDPDNGGLKLPDGLLRAGRRGQPWRGAAHGGCAKRRPLRRAADERRSRAAGDRRRRGRACATPTATDASK